MAILGLDIGTGGSRAVAIGEDGHVLASDTVDHAPFDTPDIGWAEQSPADWVRAASKAVRNVADQIGGERIRAVGLSGQMHGAVLLGADEEVLRPSIIWCDQRTGRQCLELTARIGRERLIELVSNPALTNFTLPKLLWVRDNEPPVYEKTRSLLLPKDYVRLALTGEKATDVADASGTLLLDVADRTWSAELIEEVGLDRSILPKLLESPEISGAVTDKAARETGLKAGTPVVAGAGDNAAGALGMGLAGVGSVGVTIGTSGVVFAVTDEPRIDLQGRIHTLCHAVPGRWHVTGVTQAAGLSLRWFRDTLGGGSDFGELVGEAADAPPGADGLLWAPYLMGERTPHIDPSARAALVGLTAKHRRGHVVRAILEGVAFSLRDSLEIYRELGIPLEMITLGGGGARSDLWVGIQADVYGQDVTLIEAEEGAAYGAALLAGVGTGVWKDVEEACRATIRYRRTVSPEKANAKIYDRRYEVYKMIYPALRDLNPDRPDA